MSRARKEDAVLQYYRTLYRVWGPQHWWPAETQFEVIVGAYLTQNTAWTNVELALGNLRKARVLSVAGIRKVSQPRLERLIRPSGYFRQKAARLKTFVRFLDKNYGGSLDRLFSQPTDQLRESLLGLNGWAQRLPTRFCSMREITRCSWWMPIPGESLTGTGSCGRRRITKRFDSCFSRRWRRWFISRRSWLPKPRLYPVCTAPHTHPPP